MFVSRPLPCGMQMHLLATATRPIRHLNRVALLWNAVLCWALCAAVITVGVPFCRGCIVLCLAEPNAQQTVTNGSRVRPELTPSSEVE